MVTLEHHPLHCGYPGKMYNYYDMGTPLVDSITRMYDGVQKRTCFGLFPMRARTTFDDREEAEAVGARQEARRVSAAQSHFGCPRCPRNTPYERNSESALVCCGCGVVLQGSSADESQYRDKSCAEEDDKTMRADRPQQERRDRYDGPPETAEQAQRRRLLEQRTTMPGHKSNLRNVAQLVEKDAARNARSRAQEQSGLSLKDEQKNRRILEAVEGLIQKLSPVDPAVQRRIRIAADAAFCKAARHAHCCAGVCEVRLTNRHAFIIACAVFELTVQEMIQTDNAGVDKQSLLELRNLMNRHVAFNNNASATQRNATKTSIEIMQDPTWNECVPCALPEASPSLPDGTRPRAPEGASSASSASSAASNPGSPSASSVGPSTRVSTHGPPAALPVDMRRCASSGSNISSLSTGENSDETPLSGLLEIRNAIGAIFSAHRSELPILAREGASRMLQMPVVTSVLQTDDALRHLSSDAVAYGLLHAVTRAQFLHDVHNELERPSGGVGSTPAPPLNQPIARRCGLCPGSAETVVAKLAALVPVDVSDASSETGDDDLFG